MRVWDVTWSHPALWALRQLPWRDGALVDAAVQRFASTGEGHIELVLGSPNGFWLKVAPYVVRLSSDTAAHTIVVWWVGRAWW